ncbi:MAG: MFS transporter [Acidobacteriota bacterium]
MASPSPPSTAPSGSRLLARLGLHRPDLRAWALYDWANSAFILVVITAVFPIYYQQVAARTLDPEVATARFGAVTTIALLVVAVLAPLLGALADFLGKRKAIMAAFVGLGVVATASLALVGPDDWVLALVLFALGNLGVSTSFVFYDALLPYIADEDEIDRVSTAGYALGYLGSGLLLIGILAMIQRPAWFGLADTGSATRLGFVLVALWWAVFAVPLFRRVPEPPRTIEADEHGAPTGARAALATAVVRLRETAASLRGDYREAAKMLLAMLIYNDGIGTIIRMAAIYATTRGLPQEHVIGAILMVQFVGVPCAFLFGLLAQKIGAKRAILGALVVYMGISVLAYRMETVTAFYALAFLVGTVQGGAQGLSRSLFASMVPRHKAAEFFGFFSVFEKFAGIAGPAIFTAMIWLTGSSREAILSVIVFFVVGGALLARVDVEAGRRRAQAINRSIAPSDDSATDA